MDFSRVMSELDAGLLIGGGATVLFAGLVYLMANRSDEEDEATLRYRELISSIDLKQYAQALALAKNYLVALSGKTKNGNDLGESYLLIADSADHLGNKKLAYFSAGIACRYLDEESIQSYPLYRECREKSVKIKECNRTGLTEQEIKEIEQTSEQLWVEKMEEIGDVISILEKFE